MAIGMLLTHPMELILYQWGGGDDIPVPGDFDGDGKDGYRHLETLQWLLVCHYSAMEKVLHPWGEETISRSPETMTGDGKTVLPSGDPPMGMVYHSLLQRDHCYANGEASMTFQSANDSDFLKSAAYCRWNKRDPKSCEYVLKGWVNLQAG